MGENTKIEWTQSSWNPWHGCHKVSAGCKNCYMFRDKARYGQDPNVVVRSKTKFYDPLKWKEPRTIFTCSWSDFFIEEADEWRDEAFAIMALTPQHTYQVLTKRIDRAMKYIRYGPLKLFGVLDRLAYEYKVDGRMNDWETDAPIQWPIPNVWLGVSVEDQKTFDERWPLLEATPNALPWLSIEPLLGEIRIPQSAFRTLRWVVVGGESGPDARPMHPDWARSIRDQCTAAGVPFFFKQWGEWLPFEETAQMPFYRDCGSGVEYDAHGMNFTDGFDGGSFLGAKWMDPMETIIFNSEFKANDASYLRIGKKKAGRELDGRTWDEMPEVSRL